MCPPWREGGAVLLNRGQVGGIQPCHGSGGHPVTAGEGCSIKGFLSCRARDLGIWDFRV